MTSFFDRRSVAAVGLALTAVMSPHAPHGQTQSDATATADQPEPRTVRMVDRFNYLAAFLNLAQGTVRMVVIVPTDVKSSQAAVDSVTAVVRSIPSKRLRAYLIMRGGEMPIQAAVLAAHATDPRFSCFWDSTATVAGAWESGTSVGAGVWLYDTSAKFAGAPPPAALVVTTPARTPLDTSALRREADALVRRLEAKIAHASSGSE